MVSMILAWMLKNWKVLVVVAAIFGVYAYWQSLLGEIDNLTDKVADQKATILVLEEKVKTCEANFNGVKNSIDAQNKAIGSVNRLLEKNTADWKKLTITVQGQSNEMSRRLAEILKEKKPLTCEDAMRYLLDARKGYTK